MSLFSQIRAWFKLTWHSVVPAKTGSKLVESKLAKLHLLDGDLEEFMIPRGKMQAVEEKTPLTAIWAEIKKSDNHCLPIYRHSKDNIVKIVNIGDVVNSLLNEKVPLQGTDPVFLSLQTPLFDSLELLQKHKIIIVVDEYGGTHGVMTLNRLSQIILNSLGQLSKQTHSNQLMQIKKCGANVFEVRGDTPISEIERKFNLKIVNDDEDIDTISGVVFQALERVPATGEKFLHPAGFYVHVLEAEPRRIKKLRLCLLKNKSNGENN